MIESPFEVYCKYIAIKNHFTTSYDYFKYRGKTNTSIEKFKLRTDKSYYERLSQRHSGDNLVDFLVANFKDGDKPWIGTLLGTEATDKYLAYIKRKQATAYIFQEELNKLGSLKGKFSGESPTIVRMFLEDIISIETLIYLDRVLDFKTQLDERLKDDFEWPLISRRMDKLAPFLLFDTKKLRDIVMKHEKDLLNTA